MASRLRKWFAAGLTSLALASPLKAEPPQIPQGPEVYNSIEPQTEKPFNLTLEQLTEKAKTSENDTLEPQRVKTYPSNFDPNSIKYFIVYSTAIGNANDPNGLTDENGNPNTWCGPCNVLTKLKTKEKVLEGIANQHDVALIELHNPPRGKTTSYFKIRDGVPTMEIVVNHDGSLKEGAMIRSPNMEAYAALTLDVLKQLREKNSHEGFILTPSDFERLNVVYETIPGATEDHVAAAKFRALYPDRVVEDKENERVIVTADLTDANQFQIVLSADASPNLTVEQGRNLLTDITMRGTKAMYRAQQLSPEIKEKVKEAFKRLDVRTLSPDSPDYETLHRKAFSELYDAVSQFTEPYIAPAYFNYVDKSQQAFSGNSDTYFVFPELTSPNLLATFQNWAVRNDKKLKIIHLDSGGNKNVEDTIARINENYSFLREKGIEYGNVPEPVTDELACQTTHAIYQTSHQSFDRDLLALEKHRENPLAFTGSVSLGTLLKVADQLPNPYDTTIFAIPYVPSRLGPASPYMTTVTDITLGRGGDPEAESLVLTENGNFLYAPFGTIPEEGIERIIKITENKN